jgi:hypothetical protein
MTDQDLKNKYQPVADFMSRNGFQIQHFHAENGKAVLAASAPTEYLKNRAWDEIKKVDPSFKDLQHNITVGPGTMYVVKSGDTSQTSVSLFTATMASTPKSPRPTTFPIRTKLQSASN